jgi:phage terminase large subunit-like protein
MANKLDDYLDLISFVRDQTVYLGYEGFWNWLGEQDEDFREAILAVMEDPAFSLEDHQLMPRSDWRIWMLRMGRGAGKTHAASSNVNLIAEMLYPGGYGLLVGPTYKHVRDTMILGPSGLIKTARPEFQPYFKAHDNAVIWPNGTRATIYTADDPQGIRGPSLHFAWGDELTLWKNERTFDNMFRAVREKSQHGTRLVITTSPIRAQQWVKAIETRPNTITSTASSMANIHQDKTHLAELEAEAEIGSTKAREEILGEWTTGESQLWDQIAIDEMRHETKLTPKAYAETCSRRFLSVDPSGGVHDEFGILLMGKKAKQVVFLGDYSDRLSLNGGFERVVQMAEDHLKAGDFILFELNGQRSGPMLLRKMLQDRGLSFRVIEVDAQKSKYARAEEAFLHCNMGRVKLVGHSSKLEEQLVQWEPDMKNSPDRGDAFTQGINHVLGTKQKTTFRVVSLGRL